MKLVLDSSVFISYLNEDDVFYKITIQFVESLLQKNTVIIIPVIVFLEVSNVLLRKDRNFAQEDIVDIFQQHKVVNIDLDFAKKLLPLFKKINLKTSDAIILGTAIINNATLVTWDEKLIKEAGKIANVQTPTTLLSKTDR